MAQRIVLIFGVGPNVGQSVAKAFKAKGYKIALASRGVKSENSTSEELHVSTDCSNTDAVIDAFEKVKNAWGPPHVVVYNAYSHTENDPKDAFELPLDRLKLTMLANFFSAYAAAQEAVKGWTTLPSDANLTYIYTGNCGNTIPLTPLLDIGAGKAASAAFVGVGADSYKDKQFRFYYADERLDDGTPMWNGPNGEAHAKLYVELAEAENQLPWLQTFVAGKGYKKFA